MKYLSRIMIIIQIISNENIFSHSDGKDGNIGSKSESAISYNDSETESPIMVSENSTSTELGKVIAQLTLITDEMKESRKIQNSILKHMETLNPEIASNMTEDFDIPEKNITNPSVKLHRYIRSRNKELMGIRPVSDVEEPIVVTLNVDIYQIIEMDEAEECVTVYLHVNMTFPNAYLGWSPEQFGGLTSTEFGGHDEMWIPDIFLYNGMDMKSESLYYRPIPRLTTDYGNQNASAHATAIVEYSYPRIVKFSCSFDTYYFPFDYQMCGLIFRSWTYPKGKILILAQSSKPKTYARHNDEWEVISIVDHPKTMQFGDGSKFSVYEENIILRRRPLYYIVNLLIPSIIITQVAFFGFFSPSSSDGDRTEKVNLGMGTLLAMSVLLLTVCDMTPVNSTQIPLTGLFFIINMILISFGIAVTTLIMMIHQRGKRRKRVPQLVQSIFFFRIAPLMCFKVPTMIRNSRDDSTKKLSESLNHIDHSQDAETSLMEELPNVRPLLDQVSSMMKNQRRELAEVEYKFLAKILDAIMLLVFSTLLYAAACYIILTGLNQPLPSATDEKSLYNDAKLEEFTLAMFTQYPNRYYGGYGLAIREEMKEESNFEIYIYYRKAFGYYYFHVDRNQDSKISKWEFYLFCSKAPRHEVLGVTWGINEVRSNYMQTESIIYNVYKRMMDDTFLFADRNKDNVMDHEGTRIIYATFTEFIDMQSMFHENIYNKADEARNSYSKLMRTKEIDSDNDGNVSRKEYLDYLKSYWYCALPSIVERFDGWDENYDSRIDKSEYKKLLDVNRNRLWRTHGYPVNKPTAEDYDTFEFTDLNNDTSICLFEFHAAIPSLNRRHGIDWINLMRKEPCWKKNPI